MLSQRLVNPVINNAIGNLTGGGTRVTDPLQIFISNGITVAFGLGSLILIIMLLIGAFEYITAGGDKEAIQKSTKRITQALIGILILFSIYLIAQVVGTLFGINVLQLNIPLLVP